MLILCEKPSVAKDFANTFSAYRKSGFYEFNNESKITYCVGHLFELVNPQAYNPKYLKWALEDLPIIPNEFIYEPSAATIEQSKIVLSLLRQHANDEVLIATDAGREGELIARIALYMAGIKNISKFKRFWVSEALTPDIIKKGIADAKPLASYDLLSAQGFARSRADWLIGMNLSRFVSIGNPSPAFSVGRVQTAVLSAIAHRNDEVANFSATPYKILEADILDINGVSVKAKLSNPENSNFSFFKNHEGFLFDAVKSIESGKVKIDSVDTVFKECSTKPDKLYNITGLQKDAYKLFGLNPDETLLIAQSLYETHKCLSYPRTPSRVLGDNNVDLFTEKFYLLKDTNPLSAFSDTSLINIANKHIFNSAQLEDHHALIPLDVLPAAATQKEKDIYSLVSDRFFTVCMPDRVYIDKSFVFHVKNLVFKARVHEIINPGWSQQPPPEAVA